MSDLLEVSGVTGGYADIGVLHGVDLKVQKGEIVALLGPNGHGKSTLLKAISGVHPATGGKVEFDGRDITRLSAHSIVEGGIAYIPEERYLFNDMPVVENLMLGAYNRNARPAMQENLDLVYEIFPRLEERRQ